MSETAEKELPTADRVADDLLETPHGSQPSEERSGSVLDNEKGTVTDSDDISQDAVAVTRIEAVNQGMRAHSFYIGKWLIPPVILLLYVGFILQGFATNMDGRMRNQLLAYALNDYGSSPLLGTIETTQSVVAAAIFVPVSRLSDRFGRIEALAVALLFYVLGSIVQGAAPNVGALFVGQIFFEVGYATFRLMGNVITADVSPLKWRVVTITLFTSPILITAWTSSIIVQDLGNGGWRWGTAMYAIVTPFSMIFLFAPLFYGVYYMKSRGKLPGYSIRAPGQTWGKFLIQTADYTDLPGVIVWAATMVLVLLPLSLAGAEPSAWRQAHNIVMIVIGGSLFFIFLAWELFLAKHPLVPFRYLASDGTIVAGILLQFFFSLAGRLQSQWLLYIMEVEFNENKKVAGWIANLLNFTETAADLFVVGPFIAKIGYVKPVIIFGTLVTVMGYGIMFRYRTYAHGVAGLIGAEIVVGCGGALSAIPTRALVQAAADHKQLASVTALMLCLYQVGAAVGECIATALWNQHLHQRIRETFSDVSPKIVQMLIKNPLVVVLNAKKYPEFAIGEDGSIPPLRMRLLENYAYIQRILVIVGIALMCIPVICSLFLTNYRFGNSQSLSEDTRRNQRYSLYRVHHEGRFAWLKRLLL